MNFTRYRADAGGIGSDDSSTVNKQGVWVCDSEADLPTDAEGATTGDFANCFAEGTKWKRIEGAWEAITGGSGAPTTADYLTATAQAGLSAEIVVGATPGGELGGTWGSPTVDATHSGSAHITDHGALGGLADDDHPQYATDTDLSTHEADSTSVHGATNVAGIEDITFETLDAAGDVGTGATQVSQGSHAHAGAGHTIQDESTPLTQRGNLNFTGAGVTVTDDAGNDQTDVTIDAGSGAPTDADYLVGTAHAGLSAEIVVGTAPAGELGGTWASPTVDATHSGSAHHAQSHSGADHTDPAAATTVDIGDTASAGTGTNPPAADDHVHGFPAPGAAYPLDTTFAAEADGTATTPARSDHRHTITDPTDLPANTVVGTTTGTEGASTQVARANHAHGITAYTFSIGGMLDGAGAALATGVRIIWRSPFACTVTQVRVYVDAGTPTVNAAKDNTGTLKFCSADITGSAGTWVAGTVNQNQAVAIDTTVCINVVTASTATKITTQIEATRP
jgi:hypothetical protein